MGLMAAHGPAWTPLLDRLSRATLPIYVLHHAPVLGMALLILPFGLPWFVQVPMIWGLGLAASAVLYAALVLPWRPMRLLFGMEPRYPAGNRGGQAA
jgi:hypothetical protein